MNNLRASLAVVFAAALMNPLAFASRVHRPPTSGQVHHERHATHHHFYYRHHARVRGQQAIEPARVTQIQQALIREHYLNGDPTGRWDATTIAAMQRYQSDHGWQTKLTPDSRALVKLGLGPDYSDATNAKELGATKPAASLAIPADQVAGFTAASGVSQ
ncbi:MAG TPA: peptidoglycan-binding domain-containing protein [Terracidiphilus sp.]|nr:peptidoglycan-binding domain-containing protein [Terracidiphilus sp.]